MNTKIPKLCICVLHVYVVFINNVGLLITTWLNLDNPNTALSISND